MIKSNNNCKLRSHGTVKEIQISSLNNMNDKSLVKQNSKKEILSRVEINDLETERLTVNNGDLENQIESFKPNITLNYEDQQKLDILNPLDSDNQTVHKSTCDIIFKDSCTKNPVIEITFRNDDCQLRVVRKCKSTESNSNLCSKHQRKS